MSVLQALWCEKYRPTSLDDYLFQDTAQKLAFIKHIVSGSIPNLLLSGVQGTGKSSLAKVLLTELNIDPYDLLKIDGSTENSVDMVRAKIEPFCHVYPNGSYKVVWIEEASRLTLPAQDALKDIIESNSDYTRFIFTCNHENKITPAIKSRFQHYRFQAHSVTGIIKRVTKILQTENIKFEATDIEQYVAMAYPDIRKVINLVQQHSSSGTLASASNATESNEYQVEFMALLAKDKWYQMKDAVLPLVSEESWEEFYKMVYNSVHLGPKFDASKDNELLQNLKHAYVIIAEYLYRHSIVADPRINATALIMKLSEI